MTLRILPTFAAFATLGFVSCYPYPEGPRPNQQPANQSITTVEQQRLEEQRAKLKAAAERENLNNSGGVANTGPMTDPNATPPTKPQVEPKRDYPFANPVPGKEGFVFSPYNNKVIDVRDMPTGTLVQDPTYPQAEKKYFRVP